MLASIRSPARRRGLLAALLALALACVFVWPTPFRYERRVFASVPPAVWGARPLAAFWVVDGRARPGEIPVQLRVRRNRLTGTEAVEVWRGRRGARRWFVATGFAASRDRLWAIGPRGRRAYRLLFPDPWAEPVADGRVGALRPTLGRASWSHLGKGRPVVDPLSGRERSFREAMVQLETTLVLEGRLPGGTTTARPRLYLAARDDRLLTPLQLTPGREGSLEVRSAWLPRIDLLRSAPLSVVEPVLGWRQSLVPPPE